MTQDEIIEMAREAGFLEHKDQFYTNHEYGDCKLELEAFAKLVAAKEREACAKVVEDSLWFTRLVVAKAIRARTGDKND
jgi:hypothetical protein